MDRAYLGCAVGAFLAVFSALSVDSEDKVAWGTCGICTECRPKYGVMFWNVENLFDIHDDPDKDDDEFLPDGLRRWNGWRFRKKINDIARVVHSFSDICGNPPVLLGLAEVENTHVLYRLVGTRLMSESGYAFVHHDSDDGRGIDVALLYRKEKFKVLMSEAIKVHLPERERSTRDILHVSGILDGRYRLEIFVNHWPSRFGGTAGTSFKREAAAHALLSACDSMIRAGAHVVAMGDFNDGPDSRSVGMLSGSLPVPDHKVLAGNPDDGYRVHDPGRYCCGETDVPAAGGSVRFGSEWELIDLVMFSESLLTGNDPEVYGRSFFIYACDFLLEKDSRYGGCKVFRTYTGPRYNGGYSDHLPVFFILLGRR